MSKHKLYSLLQALWNEICERDYKLCFEWWFNFFGFIEFVIQRNAFRYVLFVILKDAKWVIRIKYLTVLFYIPVTNFIDLGLLRIWLIQIENVAMFYTAQIFINMTSK